MTTDTEALPPLPNIVIRADNHYRGEGLAEAVRDYARAALALRKQVPEFKGVPAWRIRERVAATGQTAADALRDLCAEGRAALTAAPSAQAEPCQWCCGTGRFADHACRFCAGKAKGSVFAAPSAQAEPVAPFLFVAMDDDKRAHLTWCADEVAVREAVKEAMFWLPSGEELDADNLRQLNGVVEELLDSGAMVFEGDAPLYLYRVAAPPSAQAQPQEPPRSAPLTEAMSDGEIKVMLSGLGLVGFDDLSDFKVAVVRAYEKARGIK